jgi:hypothetical protein
MTVAPRPSWSIRSATPACPFVREPRRGRRHRIVNAIAAYETFGRHEHVLPIASDFGTATTRCREWCRGICGAICPGVNIR